MEDFIMTKINSLPKNPFTSIRMTDCSGFSTASKQALAAKDEVIKAMQAQINNLINNTNTILNMRLVQTMSHF